MRGFGADPIQKSRRTAATLLVLGVATLIPRFVELGQIRTQPALAAPPPSQPAATASPPTLAVAPQADTPASLIGATGDPPIALGDRLKINFYEALDLPEIKDGPNQVAQPATRSFYQRMDLTGEFVVQPNGGIVLPRLGTVAVVGRGVDEVQSELSALYLRAMGRRADIAVSIVERPPIYVVGPVKTPGAYKFIPGMMVLHAVALSGGLERGAEQAGQITDLLREYERTDAMTARLKRLLGQKARLEADRDGHAKVALPSRLVDIAGKREAEDIIALENSRLAQSRRAHLLKRDQAEALLEGTRRERQSMQARQTRFDTQLSTRSDRVRDLQRLNGKGFSTSSSLTNAQVELSDLEVRRQEALVAVAQIETRLDQAAAAAKLVENERRTAIEGELATTEIEIIEARRALANQQALVEVVGRGRGQVGLMRAQDGTGLVYELVRREPTGPVVIAAEETSSIAPGDVLRIRIPSP